MPRSKTLTLPEYVVELVESASGVLLGHGMSADQARSVALQITRVMCHRNAKSNVYIPEAQALANIERNARIWIEYQEDNPASGARKYSPQRAEELAAAYDLSPQQMYSILRAEREREVAKVQPPLF